MTVRDFCGIIRGDYVYVLRPEYSNEGPMSIETIWNRYLYKLAGKFYKDGFENIKIYEDDEKNLKNKDLLKIYTREEVESTEVSWIETTYDSDFLVHTK